MIVRGTVVGIRLKLRILYQIGSMVVSFPENYAFSIPRLLTLHT